MYYLNFWLSYWKNLAEIAEYSDGSSGFDHTFPAKIDKNTNKNTKTQTQNFIHKEGSNALLNEYGTQILALFSEDGSCNYISENFSRITGHDTEVVNGDKFYNFIMPESRERLCELIKEQHDDLRVCSESFQDSAKTSIFANRNANVHNSTCVTEAQKTDVCSESSKDYEPALVPQMMRVKLLHSNNKYQWYVFMLHPKKNANQKEIICIAENIHDNILTQNSLQKARRDAELALRTRSEFLANMSHDLRTPLNAVLGFAQMITGEILGKIGNNSYIEYAKHIQESGYDLLAKIEDLLEIASLDAGQVTLEREKIRLGEILKQLLEAQAHHAQSERIKLVCDATHNDLEIFVDRLKIQHVLGHLVANSIKNCRSGNQINIRTNKLKNGGLRIRVVDNGSGIDDIKLNQVRKALLEENCWTANHNQVIGLGLALAKELVELHGGDLVIESKLAEGTIVDILLPVSCVTSREIKPEYALVG